MESSICAHILCEHSRARGCDVRTLHWEYGAPSHMYRYELQRGGDGQVLPCAACHLAAVQVIPHIIREVGLHRVCTLDSSQQSQTLTLNIRLTSFINLTNICV